MLSKKNKHSSGLEVKNITIEEFFCISRKGCLSRSQQQNQVDSLLVSP
jgi:hypothetical protein